MRMSIRPIYLLGAITLSFTFATPNASAAPDEAATPLLRPALNAEATLQAKVSFEAKSQPLDELLRDLQKQGGAVLSASPDLHADALRVTARVKEMPLGALLAELGTVFGAVWTRNAAGEYLMEPGQNHGLGKAEQELPKVRGIQRPWGGLEQSANSGEILSSTLDEVGEAQLRTPGGVAFSSLSPELQQKIRDQVSRGNTERIFGLLDKARIEEIAKNTVHAETSKSFITSPNERPALKPEPDHLKITVTNAHTELHLRASTQTVLEGNAGMAAVALPSPELGATPPATEEP